MKERKVWNCPNCGVENTDNWPLETGRGRTGIELGGCQECWEAECSVSWWEMVYALDEAGLLEEEE